MATSYIPIPTKIVDCKDGSKDIFVELNPNPDGGGNVEAFINRFIDSAKAVTRDCYNIPYTVILAIWGGESGWAGRTAQRDNQNWGNVVYTSPSSPPGNIGRGTATTFGGNFAKYEGRTKYAKGFAEYLKSYTDLKNYLVKCQNGGYAPDPATCLQHLGNGNYGGSSSWYSGAMVWYNTVIAHL